MIALQAFVTCFTTLPQSRANSSWVCAPHPDRDARESRNVTLILECTLPMQANNIDEPADENGSSEARRSQPGVSSPSAERGSAIHLGVFALMLAVTAPRLVKSFCPTWDPLDTSWAWMLGYSIQHHLQWGISIVFTYGPLGFLTNSYFYSDHMLWGLTATVRLVAWFIFGLGFTSILHRLAPGERPFARTTLTVALAWAIGATFLHLSAQCAILGVLLLVLAIVEENHTAAATELTLSGMLLAFGALIKATALIVSLFALLAYPVLWWHAGRRRNAPHLALAPLLSFFICFCVLWLLASQSLAHLPAYVRGTWEIVSGYTPAMSITGMRLQIISALLILSLFTGALVKLHVDRSNALVAQCLLLGGVAFWAWKEGFTLQDWGYFRHPMTFYGTALLIASAGTALVSTRDSRCLKACIYAAYLIALLFAIRGYPLQRLSYLRVAENYQQYFSLISSRSRRAAEQRSQIIAIQKQFGLSGEVLRAVGDRSVNVLPWSLVMAEGYGMRLVASPVIQAYSAYTPYLDQLNARQVWGDRSAEKVIYAHAVFDDRYPPFDEPATFRALLACYRAENSGSGYAVLNHIACARPQTTAAGKPKQADLGSWVAIPRDASYASIEMQTTTIGHVAALLYKPDYVRVSFRLADGSVKGPYRFIYPVAADGLFVRYFVGSQSDADHLFSGDLAELRRISCIRVFTDSPSLDYANHLKVRFFR